MWRCPIYILMLLWQVRKMQFSVLLGRIASLGTAGAGYDPSTRTVLRWLRRNHMLLKCCIGEVPNQYFVITCTHHPTPVPLINPSRWPMVISSLSCVSAAAWVLNYINWATPQYPSLIVVPQCSEWWLKCFQYLLLYRNYAGNGYFGSSGPKGLFSVVVKYVGAKYEPKK